MNEKEFTRETIKLAKFFGWKVAHFGNTVKWIKENGKYRVIPDNQATGFPDLILAKKERLIFAELKLNKTYPAQAQKDWMAALLATGAEVYLWRPRDQEEMDKVLGGTP